MEPSQRDAEVAGSQTDQPLVSVGVPVYNGAQFLADALQSVLAQDYGRIEVVVSDNASTDGTEAIARRFASADPRVRYSRNPSNIGWLGNFRRALELATGKYFTWLAHDDFLARQDSVRVVVDYLERNPDVVLCASALDQRNQVVASASGPLFFPSLHPDVPWRKARQEFFHWPQTAVYYSVYGMYRRDELASIPFVEWTYKGRLVNHDMEYHILTRLSTRGRIVALPEVLRSVRIRLGSVGHRISDALSGFDFLLLGTRLRLTILRNAWKAGLRLRERASLLRMAVSNFFRGNLRSRYSCSTIAGDLRPQVEDVRRVAAERQQLVERLQAEINQRRQVLGAPSRTEERRPESSPRPAVAGRFSALRAFFRPPSEEDKAELRALYQEYGDLLQLCEKRLELISRLHAEAQTLLEAA